jgi:NADPH2:quinone reductase
MTQTMTAIEITKPGGPDVLVPTEREVPVPGPGEVLIKVEAAGVNRPDVLQRLGNYPPPRGASDIPGLEVAGTVVALGGPADRAMRWREGDRICALVAGGGYAEFCAAPAVQCLPIPKGMDAIPAAAIPETFFTVWTNVFQRGGLKQGEAILVHGGTSGIGTTAIQLAREHGATVFATAGSDTKAAACERLGARGINYRTGDFVHVVLDETSGRGVDIVLDIVGGDYLQRNIDALALSGRLLQIGLLGSARAQINLGPLMQKRLTLTGSTLRARSPAEKGAIAAELESHVWPLLEAKRVAPVIHATFPLVRAADAHRLLESGDVIGKLVLVV